MSDNTNESVKVPSYVPDPKKHLYVSLVKSGVRIVACLFFIGTGNVWAIAAGAGLLVAEIIGVYEELC